LRETIPSLPQHDLCYAAIRLGIPFMNGAPNLTCDIPALVELAGRRYSHRRKGLQDRTDPDEDDPGPGLQARSLGVKAGSPPIYSATAMDMYWMTR